MDVAVDMIPSQGPLLPTLPPSVPRAAQQYPQAMLTAPYTALMGVVVDGKQPDRYRETGRDRVRRQVGSTNRWRLPQSLGSDLLGTRQAIKATSSSYPQSAIRIITAEGKRSTVNSDSEQLFQFSKPEVREPGMLSRGSTPLNLRSKPMIKTIHHPDYTTPPRTAPAKVGNSSASTRQRSSMLPRLRSSKPMDVFLYHSKRSNTLSGPDVLVRALDMNWELHRPFLQKSGTLSEMLTAGDLPSPREYYKNKDSETLDEHVKKSQIYDNSTEVDSARITLDPVPVDETPDKPLNHPKHVCTRKINSITMLNLNIKDPRVTRRSLAVALGNLYHEDIEVDPDDVIGVMAAAKTLKFRKLLDGCNKIMLDNISVQTVCGYHEVAQLYNQDRVRTACESWLELNLVPQMSWHIQLRQISQSLLERLLQSNRLFAPSEFAVFRAVATWIFLQLNPAIQLMPSVTTVQVYFNSLPKSSSLIEREEAQRFASLLQHLRLHGVTDSVNIQDMEQMNIIPQSWMVGILSHHFRALQAGGDMHTRGNFHTSAIRQGFILDREPHYHSEVFSLHGFHFELRAVRHKGTNEYNFYMQRLAPGDPVLSFRQCERQTFCMRPDRDVTYSIRVQYHRDERYHMHSTGRITQRFGLGDQTSRSRVLTLGDVIGPIYVTFSFVFPPS